MDSLQDFLTSVSTLKISEKPEDLIKSKLIQFAAWKKKPIDRLLQLNHTSYENMVELLKQYLAIDIQSKDMPTLEQEFEDEYEIIPYKNMIPPEPKPNLLMAVTVLFDDLLSKGLEGSETLQDALDQYDIIMPRKVLQLILANKFNEVDTYIWRPNVNGPMFMDRKASYSTNPGSIGMQLEKELVSEPKSNYHKYYGVFQVKIEDLKICVTGEIDCVDSEGNIVEIKTKPTWSKIQRSFDIWSQSAIANVSKIVLAEFNAQRGVRDGPVTCDSDDIKVRKPSSFCTGDEYQRVSRGVLFLQNALKQYRKEGQVYSLVGVSGSVEPVVTVDKDFEFPISNTLIENLKRYIV